jgi:hypothetical protein
MWKVERVVHLCHCGFHYTDFHEAITQWIFVDMSFTNYIWITGKIWKYRQSFIYPSLHRFLLNSELFEDINCRSSLSNFSQISQILKVHIEMNLHHEIKYECHLANFHKTYTCLKSLCKELLYWIHENLGKAVVAEDRSQMDRRMWSPHKVFPFYVTKNS